ncbi:MAG TPA: hypothetical protein K8V88_07555 [Companilactobacillus farciminis]|jgi:uncharacterized membrane protein HdeD (DUF308 family)|uniref:Uncharacterized protein n=1 Tax=Companilactobacillus farciminis TaxID=1612 RepID=A0A921HSV7_9LACO|nr:hypothetical protein [Companilactobacillus farciminis]HJF87279.1 hypothetical protein [Companilactobacillus farciminis]
MASGSKAFSVFMLIFYAILLYFVFADKNMIAMYMMAIGMFIEALVNCVCTFRSKTK